MSTQEKCKNCGGWLEDGRCPYCGPIPKLHTSSTVAEPERREQQSHKEYCTECGSRLKEPEAFTHKKPFYYRSDTGEPVFRAKQRCPRKRRDRDGHTERVGTYTESYGFSRLI